jgi:hypothetical protein
LVGRNKFCEAEIAKLEDERWTVFASRDEDVPVGRQNVIERSVRHRGQEENRKEAGDILGSEIPMTDSERVQMA